MHSKLTRRVTTIVAAGLMAAALPVAFAPQAMASESNMVYAEACPEGYKGVIVGLVGGPEAYVCTNLLP
ncbi:MAG: hypothetical protein M3217_07830 [Actinomycetota bacterium]|nr:hypothetical protein [Actinomycetota bacterium]